MKYIIILSLFYGLFSCSAYYHTKQAEKHTQKALNKGATLTRDTTYVTISDTLTEIDTVDNYIRVTRTIRDTVKQECKNVYIAKSRTEVRQENRTERKRIKQENKTERETVKQQAKKEIKTARIAKRRFPFWLFFVGVAVGLVISYIWRNLKPRL